MHLELEYFTLIPVQRLGCFKDTSRRAIPQLDGKSRLLRGNYQRRRFAIEKCVLESAKRGYRVFGVQNGGWCASGPHAHKTYAKYGRSNRCRNGKGGPWANDVYLISGLIACFLNSFNGRFLKLFFVNLFWLFFFVHKLPGKCRKRTTQGNCCVFPFRYRRRVYNGCARNRRGQRWCALTPDYSRDKLWGYCRGGRRRKWFFLYMYIHIFGLDYLLFLVISCTAYCFKQEKRKESYFNLMHNKPRVWSSYGIQSSEYKGKICCKDNLSRKFHLLPSWLVCLKGTDPPFPPDDFGQDWKLALAHSPRRASKLLGRV